MCLKKQLEAPETGVLRQEARSTQMTQIPRGDRPSPRSASKRALRERHCAVGRVQVNLARLSEHAFGGNRGCSVAIARSRPDEGAEMTPVFRDSLRLR